MSVALKLITDNGRERRSDGLFKHLGLIDAGSLRAQDNQTSVRSGAGLELFYLKPTTSYVQSYDRDAQAYRDLNITGKNINLLPFEGGKVTLPAGTAQEQIGSYRQAVVWNVPTNGVWTESVASVTGTFAGAPLVRLEACGAMQGNTAGMYIYVGFGLDGAVCLPSQTLCQPATANAIIPFSIIGYWGALTGSHRFAIFAYTSSGVGGFFNGTFATLYVTEQRA